MTNAIDYRKNDYRITEVKEKCILDKLKNSIVIKQYVLHDTGES